MDKTEDSEDKSLISKETFSIDDGEQETEGGYEKKAFIGDHIKA